MKTRINKYLVGALLCAITHNGYSMEAGIDVFESNKLNKLATDLRARLKAIKEDTKNNKVISKLQITLDNKKVNYLDTVTSLLNTKDKEQITQAIRATLGLIDTNWDKLKGDPNKKMSIPQIFSNLEIGDTKLEIKELAIKQSELEQLKANLASEKEIQSAMYHIDESLTVNDINIETTDVTNKATMLYDKDSRLRIKNKEDHLDIKTAISIEIIEEPIGKERLATILKSKADTYYLFKPDEDEAIRNYIAEQLKDTAPTTAAVEKAYNTFYDTEISAKGPAGEALREYIRKMQHFKKDVLTKYETINAKLKKGEDLQAQLDTINNTNHIDKATYNEGYTINEEAKKQLKEFRDKYGFGLNESTIVGTLYDSNDNTAQYKQGLKKIDIDVMINGLEAMKKKIEDETKEKEAANKNITKITNEKLVLTNTINTQKTTIKTKEDEIKKITKEKELLNKEKESKEKELEKVSKELEAKQLEVSQIKVYQESMLECLGLTTENDPVYDFANISNEMQDLKEKTKGMPSNEAMTKKLQEKDEEINKLNAEIQKLKSQPVLKGGKNDNAVLQKKISELSDEIHNRDEKIQKLEKELSAEKLISAGNKKGLVSTDKLLEIFDNINKKAPNNRFTLKEIHNEINKELVKDGQSPIMKPEEEKK